MRMEKTFVEDTSLNTIRSKLRADNTSGIKGVSWRKESKKWVAQITFKKKRYNLGSYDNIEDAMIARKNAEEKFFKPIIEKYNIK